jgi:hypothetical protein
MEGAEEMDIQHQTKIIPHNKNTTRMAEAAGQCPNQEEAVEEVQCKDPLQRMAEEASIPAEVAKVEDILRMAVLGEEADLLH